MCFKIAGSTEEAAVYQESLLSTVTWVEKGIDPDPFLPHHLFIAFRNTLLHREAVTKYRRAAAAWLADPKISVTGKFLVHETPL